MYRAREYVDHEDWLTDLETAADRLELEDETRSRAADIFLSTLPDEERSKRATMATSLYVATLLTGEEHSQQAVADAADVSRLTIQQRWKDLLEEMGLDAPDW
jgi:transcription initiation factor TFIIIB Brf1 subunit/transcription initiation factor TFIIB